LDENASLREDLPSLESSRGRNSNLIHTASQESALFDYLQPGSGLEINYGEQSARIERMPTDPLEIDGKDDLPDPGM
jgi:hypothetical protein